MPSSTLFGLTDMRGVTRRAVGMECRCAFAPEYLRCAEGRRFLSALFCLQPQLSKELQAIVRNQIPSGRKSVLQVRALPRKPDPDDNESTRASRAEPGIRCTSAGVH